MRISSTPISFLGSSTSYTFSSAGGLCNGAFVFVSRVINSNDPTVTYGGQSMKKLAQVTDGNSHNHYIFGLQNCPTGIQNVVITCSTSNQTRAGATTYNNVDKSATFPNVSNTGLSNTTTNTVSVTTTKNDCFLIGIGGANGLSATRVFSGTATTEISYYDGGGTSDDILESNPLDVGVAGAYSLQVQAGAINQDLSLIVCAIATSNAPISQPTFFPLF